MISAPFFFSAGEPGKIFSEDFLTLQPLPAGSMPRPQAQNLVKSH
jgi:hypothetical protein